MQDLDIQGDSFTDTPAQVLSAMGKKTSAASAFTESETTETVAETAVESEPTETETEVTAGEAESDATETEVEAEENEETEETPPETEKKGKKKSGFQRRINKLRGEMSAKDQELSFLRSELQRTRGAGANPDAAAIAAENAAKAKLDDGRPKKDDFETHDAYVEALTDWKVESKLSAEKAKTTQSQVQSAIHKRDSSHQERTREFVKTHPDFTDVVAELDDASEVSLTLKEVILNSENGPELMYQLAKNRKEFERINALTPLAAAREIGKFESKFAKPSAATDETKTTRAPAPVNPISGKGTVSTKDPNKMEFDEYKAWHKKTYG